MKNIITCICLLFAAGLMAQTTPSRSSQARKINMAKTNGKVITNSSTEKMTDSVSAAAIKGDIGIETSAVDGGLVILGFTTDNSTARAAKLKEGDIITSINSKKIATVEDLENAIAAYEPGDVVTVSYTRGVRELTKEVRINRR